MICWPTKLTWLRWWMLVSHSELTLLRALEIECFREMNLEGITLDVGGGEASSYYHILSNRGDIHAVNLDSSMVPTYVADFNRGLPVATNSYNNIISLNTLEHICEDVLVVQEMFRTLKPEGQLYLFVPFIHRVHTSDSVSDYHRHTAHFWVKALEQIGFVHNDIQIKPLVFGPLAAPLSLVEYVFLTSWSKILVRAFVLLLSMLWAKIRPMGIRSSGSDTPLGYLIRARK